MVDNVYTDLPDGFYLERNLWIQKNVIKDGQQITTDDTFYATVKEVDPDTGEETTVITTELTQNDRVAVNSRSWIRRSWIRFIPTVFMSLMRTAIL